MSNEVKGTSRIIDEVDDYLKKISSTATDFKTDEMGFGLKYLNKYFKPTNGESMLQYYDKIIKGIENEVEMEKIATQDYLDLNPEGKDTVCEIALAIVNYADERNRLSLADHSLNGDFINAAYNLGYDHSDDKESKFIYLEDSLPNLGESDIGPILERIRGLGVMQKEVETVSDMAKEYAPFILEAVDTAGAPAGCYDLVLDLLNSLNALNSMTRFVRKLKYISKKEGRSIEVGYDRRGTRSNNYVSDIKYNRNKLDKPGDVELDKMREGIYKTYEGFMGKDFASRFVELIEAQKNPDQLVSDTYWYLRAKWFNIDQASRKDLIKSKVLSRSNEGVVDLNNILEQDHITCQQLAEAIYFVLLRGGSDDAQSVYDFAKLIEYPEEMFHEENLYIPKDYEMELLITYTFIFGDTIPVIIQASNLKNRKLGDAIQVLFTTDGFSNYRLKPEAIEEYMLKLQPNFNGKYQISDVVSYMNNALGGMNKVYGVAQEDIQEFAEVVTLALNDLSR